MSNNIKKIVAMLLTFMLVFALAACNNQADPTSTATTAPVTTASPTTAGTETPAPTEEAKEPTTLVVGYSNFSEKFSPFFSKTAYDKDVYAMTQISILENDRAGNIILNGIDGETANYNGTDYFYDGAAKVEIVQNADGTVDYNITIRDDLVFSDGVPVTIDDVIFSMYAFSDPTYDGGTTFYSLPIIGMKNFRSGVSDEIYTKYEALATAIFEAGEDNADFSAWTQEQQEAFFGEYLDEAGEKFAAEIIDYCISNYASYLSAVNNSEVALGMYVWGFGDFDEENESLFITAVTETAYDLSKDEEPTVADYWAEILAAYGKDFSADGLNVESAGSAIEDLAIEAFISGEGPKDAEAGGEIMNIEGIKRTGDYSVTVTTEYFEATSIYQFGLSITPLHYYGDVALYDYDNNMFGFPKGDLSSLRAKTTKPMGAGAYKFLSYENGVVSFEANENYRKGKPVTDYILFQETNDADKLTGIISGSFDITDPSFSQSVIDSIKGYNANGELTGDIVTTNMVDFLGYGYIGINSVNVSVAGDQGSQASKDLRSAFATVLAVYRDTVINSYYGDRASVIQYPISNTSWAAPRPNDEGYRIAYSVDVDGNSIYTDAMSEDQKYAAAIEAAIGFLKAAGYTFDDASGKFTAAPEGAEMAYEIIIPGDGAGDHPSYGILTAAKEALASIGITLEINDPANSNVLWTAIEAGEAEMWVAAWGATLDPDMYQVYYSKNAVGGGGTDSNHYAIADDELDELIFAARQSADKSYRKATYKRCLDIVMEWAVEIPTYQRQEAIIFSSERVNMDTITPDITTFWGWMNDIELIEVK